MFLDFFVIFYLLIIGKQYYKYVCVEGVICDGVNVVSYLYVLQVYGWVVLIVKDVLVQQLFKEDFFKFNVNVVCFFFVDLSIMKVFLGFLGYLCKIYRKRSKISINRFFFIESDEYKFERSISNEDIFSSFKNDVDNYENKVVFSDVKFLISINYV